MKFEVQELENDILKVNLIGRLDLQGTLAIDERFTSTVSTSKKNTIVDMSELNFLASIGIRMLLSNAKSLQQRKKKMVLLDPQSAVADTLTTSGITQFLPIFYTLDEAIAHF